MAIGPLGVHAAHFGKPKNEKKPLATLRTGSAWLPKKNGGGVLTRGLQETENQAHCVDINRKRGLRSD